MILDPNMGIYRNQRGSEDNGIFNEIVYIDLGKDLEEDPTQVLE